MAGDLPTHPPEVEDDTPIVAPVVPEVPVVAPTPAPAPVVVPPTPTSPLAGVDKEALLTFIEDTLDTLTFKRVALVALLAACALIIFSLYENRQLIVNAYTKPIASTATDAPVSSKWVLSEESKASLQTLAKTTAVGMIIVSDVDLKKNRRAARYYYLDDPTIKLEPTALQALSLPLPVFDYDAKNTEQMVAILSNEFRCDPYKDTIYFRHAPELADKFPTICRIAIPPFVGQFVGFLTVGLSGEVPKEELDSIRLEVSRIAVEIYLNDVMKKTAPAK